MSSRCFSSRFWTVFVGLLSAGVMAGASAIVAPTHAETSILDQDEIIRYMLPSSQPRKRGIAVGGAGGRPEAATAFTPLALQAIQFELNSAHFTPRALEQTRALGRALNHASLARFTFTVAGHTDSRGRHAYNRELSKRRARAVKDYLVTEMKVASARLIDVGFGEDYPLKGVAPEDPRNRRVEVANRGILPSPMAGTVGTARPKKRRALLIGIDDYQHVSKLKGPVNDAASMAAFVRSTMGFRDADVRMLLNEEATRAGILGAIEEWLVKGTRAGDDVFLYFSGHGFQRQDQNGDEADGLDETLIPVDAYVDDHRLVRNMVADDEVAALLDRLEERRVWVVVDACHAGTSARSTALGSPHYQKTPRMPDGSPLRVVARTTRGVGVKAVATAAGDGAEFSFAPAHGSNIEVWSAVEAHQKALVDSEAPGQGGSVFTRRLLWGARDREADADNDGHVTVRELFRYVTEQSADYCRKYPSLCEKGLTPQLQGAAGRLDDGAFSASRPAVTRTAVFAKDVLVTAAASAAPRAGEGLRLRLRPGTRIALDTKLEVVVQTNRAGQLVVLDVDAEGNLTQIFPNDFSERAGVASNLSVGQTIQLPGVNAGFEFRAVPPVGKGLLLAVVSDTNPRLTAVTARYKDLSAVPTPDAYVVEIERALRASVSATGGGGWDLATLEYEIVSALGEQSPGR